MRRHCGRYYLMFIYVTPFLGGMAGRQVPGIPPIDADWRHFLRARVILLARDRIDCDLLSRSVLLFVGNGFFKPNISTMVGNLYPAGSPLKDSAYNIFYMGINIGALLAPIVAEGAAGLPVLTCSNGQEGRGPLADQAASLRSGFLTAFYAAAAGMTLGTIILLVVLSEPGRGPTAACSAQVGRHGRRRGDRRLFPAPRSSRRLSKYPSGSGSWRSLVIYGDRDRLLDGVSSERQHDDVLGGREHRPGSVSGVISNAINPFWIVVLSIPLINVLELAAEERARAFNPVRRWRSGMSAHSSLF